MTDPTAKSKLDVQRRQIATTVRALRQARRWTQAALAQKLGTSQARLSELEAGDGSFSAEQLLAILSLFNIDVAEFSKRGSESPEDVEVQNALVRHGARHLREVSGAPPSGRFRSPSVVVRDVLLNPVHLRWVASLAPVVVWSVDEISMPALHHELAQVGRGQRLGWLLENVHEAAEARLGASGPWRRRLARARVVIDTYLQGLPRPAHVVLDPLDPDIRSKETVEAIWEAASPVSRTWGVVSSLRPEDFRAALEQAVGTD